jgi:hypothetical protein
MLGVDLNPGAGGTSITATSAVPFRDVYLYNIPQSGLASFFAANSNLLSVVLEPAGVSSVFRKTIDFTKSLTSATPTNILKLDNFQNAARFRLFIMATVGAGMMTKQYDFIITSQTIVGGTDPIVTNLSTFSNGNWNISIGALTLTGGGVAVTVGLTVTTSGALGTGQPGVIYGQLDCYAYALSATGGVYAL